LSSPFAVLSRRSTVDAQLTTTDVYAAGTTAIALYFFWRFLREGSWRLAVASALTLGLTQVAKYTAIVLFPLFMLAALLFHMPALLQAIAEGQYEYPRGLFYGGAELQPGLRHYAAWLGRRCARAQYLFALDVHTGLGRWSEHTLILEPGVGVTPPAALMRALKETLVDPARGESDYVARGSMSGLFAHAIPGARADFLLQELGTYPVLRVLGALREENRWHHHGGGTPEHPAKRALLEVFSPASAPWRRRVVARGTELLRAVCKWTFHDMRAV
jgi:hypothetical protein